MDEKGATLPSPPYPLPSFSLSLTRERGHHGGDELVERGDPVVVRDPRGGDLRQNTGGLHAVRNAGGRAGVEENVEDAEAAALKGGGGISVAT